jgi:hypothetical protein
VKDPIETLPLFDIATHPKPTTTRRPFPGPRTIRRVLCAAGAHWAGLMLSGDDHLVWRPHMVHTGGSAWQCTVSGRCLCDRPAPDVPHVKTPTCDDHDGA